MYRGYFKEVKMLEQNLIKQAKRNKETRNKCKDRIEGNIYLYSNGYITLREFLEEVEFWNKLYNRALNNYNDILNETRVYSDDRHQLLEILN